MTRRLFLAPDVILTLSGPARRARSETPVSEKPLVKAVSVPVEKIVHARRMTVIYYGQLFSDVLAAV